MADVARAFSGVKRRSTDLLRLNVDELEENGLRTAGVIFQPRPHCNHQQQQQAMKDDETENVVGRLMISEDWNKVQTKTVVEPGCDDAVPDWSLFDDDDDESDHADAEAQGNL